MKEKYHKLPRENKFNHGSYDIVNRLHLFKKFKKLITIIDNNDNIIDITLSEQKSFNGKKAFKILLIVIILKLQLKKYFEQKRK